MIKVDSSTMKKIDSYCIETLGIDGIILMENAALKVFYQVEEKLTELNKKCVAIVCGVGNNGGDGLAVARHLYLKGYEVRVFIVGNIEKGSKDFNINFNILRNIKEIDDGNISIAKLNDISTFSTDLGKADIIVDGIFGTGLKRKVEGVYKEVISAINEAAKYTIAIDVPSGVSSDGEGILGCAVKADETITLQLYKKGFDNETVKEFCGDIKVVHIGIPKKVIDKILTSSDQP